MKIGLISLVLIAVIVISTITAVAHITNAFNFGGGQLSQGGWDVQSGNMVIKDGALNSIGTGVISRAVHSVSVEPSGSFTSTFTFTINDPSSDVLAGVADSNGQETLAGYNGGGSFVIAGNGVAGVPNTDTEYTVKISSDDGQSFNVQILSGGSEIASRTVSGVPTSVILRITNESDSNGPAITSATFDSTAPTSTPTATPVPGDNPTVTPSPTAQAVDHSDMMNWYANNYVPPVLSNQSYIYNDDGKLVQVVTGKPGEATTTPTSGVVVAGESANLTAPAIANLATPAGNATTSVIKNSTMPTVMPKTTVPAAPTKTQSPGFGILLVAISMMAALFYISRKK